MINIDTNIIFTYKFFNEFKKKIHLKYSILFVVPDKYEICITTYNI